VSTAARVGGQMAAEVILPKAELEQRTRILWDRIEDGSFAKSLQDHLGKKQVPGSLNASEARAQGSGSDPLKKILVPEL